MNALRTRNQRRSLVPAAALTLAALAVSGCGPSFAVDRASAEGATLRWYTLDASIDEAQATAATHCQRYDKRARLIEEFEDQDVTLARFACG
jgi:spermidine/putrescine-binding protein